MNNLKKGTPGYGILIGCCCAALGVLLLTIGFWKTLLLAVLFAVGFFLGTVENKSAFLKEKANRILPNREAEVIDLKSELARQQGSAAPMAGEVAEAIRQAGEQVPADAAEAAQDMAGAAEEAAEAAAEAAEMPELDAPGTKESEQE